MKKIALSIILSLLLSFGGYVPVHADAPFEASEDTIGYFFLPDTNLNGNGLWADYTYNAVSSSFGTGYRTYLKFNLNTLTADVTSEVKIRLYTMIPAITTFGVSIYAVDDAWSETTLTWNNSVAAHPPGTELDRKFAPTTAGAYIEFTGANLANYINAQFKGDKIASFVIVQSATCPSSCSISDTVAFADSEDPILSHRPQLDPSNGPTAITLIGFSGQSMRRNIILEWETAQEIDLIGFNVYRSDSFLEERFQINQVLIPGSEFGSLIGDTYQFVDGTTLPGRTYYYWLELVMMNGDSSLIESGQVRTNSGGFLPLVPRY